MQSVPACCCADWVAGLARDHAGRLAAIARREGAGAADALDLVQDAFHTLLVREDLRDRPPEEAVRVLSSIVRNAARNLRSAAQSRDRAKGGWRNEKEGSESAGPCHCFGVRQLICALSRGQAARVIGLVGPDAKAALPAMREAFKCKGINDDKIRDDIRMGVAIGLRGLNTAAKDSLPDLIPVMEDPRTPSNLCSEIANFVFKLKGDGKEAWSALRRMAADNQPDEDRRVIARGMLKKIRDAGLK